MRELQTVGMEIYDHEIERARQTLSEEVATQLSGAYTDNAVYLGRLEIDRAASPQRQFPGWPDDVLIVAVENQGVCSWGVSLAGASRGVVVVGGDLAGGSGTTPYAPDLATYVRTRKWDKECLDSAPLLQAQGAALDERTASFLRSRFSELDPTFGWPCAANYRFETDGVPVMLWSDDEQCDWWISGDEHQLGGLASRTHGLLRPGDGALVKRRRRHGDSGRPSHRSVALARSESHIPERVQTTRIGTSACSVRCARMCGAGGPPQRRSEAAVDSGHVIVRTRR